MKMENPSMLTAATHSRRSNQFEGFFPCLDIAFCVAGDRMDLPS
jgi:hypothetical protein